MTTTPFASAVLVAAGRSTRMGTQAVPKPFLPLLDRPILQYSLQAFHRAATVAEIVIVGQEEHFARIETLCGPYADRVTRIVAGGEQRFHSVLAGCQHTSAQSEVLLIHDAARPLIQVRDIDRVAEAAREKGAALLATPVTDSVHRSMDGRKVFEPVDRSNLWAAQTPQGFQRRAFLKVLQEAERLGSLPTDDVALYERMVGAVELVPGPPENLKITHPADLAIAEALLRYTP